MRTSFLNFVESLGWTTTIAPAAAAVTVKFVRMFKISKIPSFQPNAVTVVWVDKICFGKWCCFDGAAHDKPYNSNHTQQQHKNTSRSFHPIVRNSNALEIYSYGPWHEWPTNESIQNTCNWLTDTAAAASDVGLANSFVFDFIITIHICFVNEKKPKLLNFLFIKRSN